MLQINAFDNSAPVQPIKYTNSFTGLVKHLKTTLIHSVQLAVKQTKNKKNFQMDQKVQLCIQQPIKVNIETKTDKYFSAIKVNII